LYPVKAIDPAMPKVIRVPYHHGMAEAGRHFVDALPSIPHGTSVEGRIELSFALWNTAEELLLAGLRDQVNSDEELRQAVRRRHRQAMDRRDYELYGLKPPMDIGDVGRPRWPWMESARSNSYTSRRVPPSMCGLT
jgi:hypothetical protein